MINPESIPPTPLYIITLTAVGAHINGEPVQSPPGDVDAARVAALAEIKVKAAFAGRPVRVVAKEIDGSAWPMIVDAEGTVITLSAPHPAPAPAPQPAAPVVHAPLMPARHAPQPPPATRPPASPVPHTPAPPAHAPQPPPAPAAPMPHTAASAPPPPAAAPPPAMDWTAPLPAAYEPFMGRLRAAEQAGDLPAAIVAADQLEQALEGAYGPLHPYTVNVLTLRATLTTRQGADWFDMVELLTRTALRRDEAGAHPVSETRTTARNAHAAWKRLSLEDPEGAMELCESVVKMLTHFGEERRTQDILNWVEKTRMGSR